MYPDTTAESARLQKANKENAMDAAEKSVNTFIVTFLIWSVNGIAEDVDDIKRYARTWNQTICQWYMALLLLFA